MMDVFHLVEGVTTVVAAVGWLAAHRAYNDEHQRATALERDLDNRDRDSDYDHLMLQIANSRIKDLIGQVDQLAEERDTALNLSVHVSAVLDKVQAEIDLGMKELEKEFLNDETEDKANHESQRPDESAEGATPCGCDESYVFLHADGGSDVRA